nr:GrpE homolog - bovine (fragments) [Bos taurus]
STAAKQKNDGQNLEEDAGQNEQKTDLPSVKLEEQLKDLLEVADILEKFDPYEHEALFHTPVEGKEPGTVALVNKDLRPALVGVVK